MKRQVQAMISWDGLTCRQTFQRTRFSNIEQVAASLHEKAEIIVVVGIGGSYLGAKSIISAMSHNFDKFRVGKKGPDVIFAGQNIGEDYLSELVEVLDTRSYAIIVISKSGTTTEPAIAFRILKEHLEEKVGPGRSQPADHCHHG